MVDSDDRRSAPRLLTLPAEIRQLILKHLLVKRKELIPTVALVDEIKAVQLHVPQHYWDLALRLEHASFKPETTLAVARTCKQLYNEALFIYYGFNTFKFEHHHELFRYLHGIGLERMQCLRNLDFGYNAGMEDRGYRGPLWAMEQLCRCANLRKLVVRIDTRSMRLPLDLFRLPGLQKLREIRGCRDVVILGTFSASDEFIPQMDHLRDFKRVVEEELCWAKGGTTTAQHEKRNMKEVSSCTEKTQKELEAKEEMPGTDSLGSYV